MGFVLFLFSSSMSFLAKLCKTTFFQYFSTVEMLVLERMIIVKVMDATFFTVVGFTFDDPSMFFSSSFFSNSCLFLIMCDFGMSLFSSRRYIRESWIGYLNLISVSVTWA